MADGIAEDFKEPSPEEASLDAATELSRGATQVVAAVRAALKADDNAQAALESLAKSMDAGKFAATVRPMAAAAGKAESDAAPGDTEKKRLAYRRIYNLVCARARTSPARARATRRALAPCVARPAPCALRRPPQRRP